MEYRRKTILRNEIIIMELTLGMGTSKNRSTGTQHRNNAQTAQSIGRRVIYHSGVRHRPAATRARAAYLYDLFIPESQINLYVLRYAL